MAENDDTQQDILSEYDGHDKALKWLQLHGVSVKGKPVTQEERQRQERMRHARDYQGKIF